MQNSILSILAAIILLGCNQNHGTIKTAESGNELVENYREPIENRIAKFISDGYLLLDSASGCLDSAPMPRRQLPLAANIRFVSSRHLATPFVGATFAGDPCGFV